MQRYTFFRNSINFFRRAGVRVGLRGGCAWGRRPRVGGVRGMAGGGGGAAAQGDGRARGPRARPAGRALCGGGSRPRPRPPARDGPARRRPAAAARVRGRERPPRAGECVGMFHEEHHCNGLIFSTLRLTTTASATANVPKLPQQYFAGAMATRLQM